VPVELYDMDGSAGAAIGAGIGAAIFKSEQQAFEEIKPLQLIEPTAANVYNSFYFEWKKLLEKQLGN
jgi:xylulokinase